MAVPGAGGVRTELWTRPHLAILGLFYILVFICKRLTRKRCWDVEGSLEGPWFETRSLSDGLSEEGHPP